MSASTLAKPPVTLRTVFHTMCNRLGRPPETIMRSEAEGLFGADPRVVKYEAKFSCLEKKAISRAMRGLDVVKPITEMKVKGLSYSHIAQWGHSGKTIRFKLSMYYYKDKSCLFILTPEEAEVKPKPKAKGATKTN